MYDLEIDWSSDAVWYPHAPTRRASCINPAPFRVLSCPAWPCLARVLLHPYVPKNTISSPDSVLHCAARVDMKNVFY